MRAKRTVQPKVLLTLAIVGVAAVFTYISAVSANSIQVIRSIFAALFGSYVNVTNTVVAVDRGFALSSQSISAAGTMQASPVVFSSTPGLATNGVTAGDWVVTILVNTTSNTPISTLFSVVLHFNQGGSSESFTLYLETGTTVLTVGQPYEILCQFDLGSTLSSPYSYTFTVQ